MKKILLPLIITTLGLATTYEYQYTFKDPRVMGMGGANVAVGGDASSIFYNPAGLAKRSTENSVDFSLAKLAITTNENVVNPIYSIAIDKADATTTVMGLLGENIHLSLNNFNYLAVKMDNITASLGLFESADVNLKVHNGFGNTGLLGLNSALYFGPIASTSFSVDSALHLGASMKYIGAYQYTDDITIGDLMDTSYTSGILGQIGLDNLPGSFMNKLSYGFGLDFGAIYDLDNLRKVSDDRLLIRILDLLNPSIGVSMINIMGLRAGNVTIPQTLNAGISMRPYNKCFKDLVVTAEINDILDGYTINQSRGLYGKLRMGVEAYPIKNLVTDLAFRAGWYNGQYTAGIDWRIAMLHLGYNTYVEELGGYIGQDPDRRHTINLSLSF